MKSPNNQKELSDILVNEGRENLDDLLAAESGGQGPEGEESMLGPMVESGSQSGTDLDLAREAMGLPPQDPEHPKPLNTEEELSINDLPENR